MPTGLAVRVPIPYVPCLSVVSMSGISPGASASSHASAPDLWLPQGGMRFGCRETRRANGELEGKSVPSGADGRRDAAEQQKCCC